MRKLQDVCAVYSLSKWMEMTKTEIAYSERVGSESRERLKGVHEGKRLGGAGEVRRGSGNERRRDWK